MNNTLVRRGAVALGVAIAAVGGGAAAWAATGSVTASATDTVVTSTSAHSLSVNGGTFTDVLDVSLPAGYWVVSADGNLVDWGPSDYTRCHITVGGTQIAAVSTMVGNGSASGAHGPASFLSPFSLTGGVTLTSPATATLQCWHDETVSTSGYVDPGATLWAHKTGSLKVAGE
jgi:hypothetical protein